MPVERSLPLRWVPAALWCATIFYLSSLPGDSVALPSFPGSDKIAHLVVYSAGAVLFAWAMANSGPERFRHMSRIFVCTVAFCLFYGIGDEFHQSFVPGRSVSSWDVLADTLGGALGAVIYLNYGKRRTHD